MPVLYDIRWRKPVPLVPRRLRFEVEERIDNHGRIERALDEAAATQVIDAVLAADVDAIAICLINAYANGVHEARVRDLIRERDASIPVSISSELLPEIREYERTSTTVVNGYVLPLVRHYLEGLDAKLRERKITKPLTIMQSSGGAMSAAAAAERPIHIIESGPAAGVVGAAELARRLGNLSLLSFDMGGTTAKAALIDAGQYLRVNSLEVGGGINIAGRLLSGGGYHVRAPGDRHRRSRRGRRQHRAARRRRRAARRSGERRRRAGSRVLRSRRHRADGHRRQRHPRLHQSAGARRRRPADSARARGGVAAGRHRRAAQAALEDAAWGVHRVANATMARALRAVSTERGRDPRELAMLAFGGNGPVHAATLARLLDIRKILVPPVPGLFSALGMLFPEMEHHYVRTYKRRLEALDKGELERVYQGLEAEGAMALLGEGFVAASIASSGWSTCATPAPIPS